MGRLFAILTSTAFAAGVLLGLLIAPPIVEAGAQPGAQIHLSKLDYGSTYGSGDWTSMIQIKNTSNFSDSATITFWGEPGPCAPNENTELFTMQRWLPAGTTATLPAGTVLNAAGAFAIDPLEIRSATITANSDGDANEAKLGAVVWRKGPDDAGLDGASVYEGISEFMDGSALVPSIFEYFAPKVMKGFFDLDTELAIQNAGEYCTSVRIEYREQIEGGGTCVLVSSQHITALAVGEAVRVRVPDFVASRPFLGSAHIRANQPLAIVSEETSFTQDQPATALYPQHFTAVSDESRGTLLTDRAEVWNREDTKHFAAVIFSELSGWQTSINVQNKSVSSRATFVTVSFFDNGGGHLAFLGEWVCYAGAQTFFLSSMRDVGLPFGGAVEIQSQSQIGWPGGGTNPGEPIFAVVGLKKSRDFSGDKLPPGVVQGASYNAQSLSGDSDITQLEMPFVAREFSPAPGTPGQVASSIIAIRNNSSGSIVNLELRFGDETESQFGNPRAVIPRFGLRPKQVKIVDLRNISTQSIPRGWTGALLAEVQTATGMAAGGTVNVSAVVVTVAHGAGATTGDLTTAYSAFPSP